MKFYPVSFQLQIMYTEVMAHFDEYVNTPRAV